MIENTANKDLVKCPVCETYVTAEEGFVCPKCRRGPLCKSHRLPGERFCSGCSIEISVRELRIISSQEQSIKGFLRLTQFVFLLCAVFFVSLRTGILENIEFFQEIPVTEYVLYPLFAISIAGYITFYLILLGQRKNIADIEEKIKKYKYRRIGS